MEPPWINNEREEILNQWMHFLNAQTREELVMAAQANPGFRKMSDIYNAMSRRCV